MSKRLYLITRDLHLYLGLFISPFVLVFAVSVFFLVHAWLPASPARSTERTAGNLRFDQNLEALSGRERVDALRGVLDQLGIQGEVGFVGYIPSKHRLVVPVSVPGREIRVEIDLASRTALVAERATGIGDALVALHKAPGPHLAAIRGNWFPMRVWLWFADGTVYLLLFISFTGIYLWAAVRSERHIGLALIAAGAFSFLGVVYVISR